jgi:hypothetical protein
MDKKAWYQSKTVIGGILAVLATIAGAFGFTVVEADQVALVDNLAAVGTAVGGLLAIYGRITAKTKIQ